jgi:23S rRNA pseudouridine955/2504/2580 synthase/23S rRNA pseudouridine1911/1915/1917 synthase
MTDQIVRVNIQSMIIFENDDFVVINKPSGLLSIPDREGKEVSVKRLLQEKFGNIFTVHRIDRDTSGIIVFAKNEETHKYLSGIFEDRSVEKIYRGIVQGTLPEKEKTIEAPIMEHPVKKGTMIVHAKGKESITQFNVVEEFGKFSEVEFRILTGRTHQIRVHMANYGHPIICDAYYGSADPILLSSLKKKFKLSKDVLDERPIMGRLALHAYRLKFKDRNGLEHEFEAEIPKDMRAFEAQLRKMRR